MKRVMLGTTGLQVNRLGFGGIPIQRIPENEAVDLVRHAVEQGCDFIDTSRMHTTSERRIRMALRQAGQRAVLATKSFQRSDDGIRADIETSLRELQVDYIDIYQCHAIRDDTEYRQITSAGGALAGLHEAKERGLIGHIGITTHSLDLLDRVLDDGLFETIMVCFSFLEPAARGKIIPKARDEGVGMIVMKPFSGGVIDNARLALKYTLGHEGLVVIAGVDDKRLFDENWAVFQGDWKLDDGEARQIDKLRQAHDKIFCRRCDYCQPCSEGIPIQVILGIRSMVKRMGKEFLQNPFASEAIKKARACSDCGECETRCPYQLPIRDLMKENLRWVDEQL
jgi:predicted aldo/keto reductase-like oxidoreductase